MSRYTPDFSQIADGNTYYALTMFPYPSGAGLHCGHASVFTITDVLARYQRMLWKTVFMPFGFDAFGLPTENYAIKLEKPAREVTDINKEMFLKQIHALNISFDYDKVLDTSTPEYYKWTQRIFQKLFKAGLVYRDTLWVNRCPSCQTVLANDQVVDGKCERCKSEIQQQQKPQWFIKITDYADRLIKDLDLVDWPQETKTAQKNRIGRSEWAEIDFVVQDRKITVFTTRPDTIYGVTALVLAPENTDIDIFLDQEHQEIVQSYRNEALAKTAVQRQQDSKEKSGVNSWVTAIHPFTEEEIPVWFADYVLPDYGTWAVMMVPAHDERDFEFAQKFDVPIVQVIEWDVLEGKKVVTSGILTNSGTFDGLGDSEAKEKIISYLEATETGRSKISYKLRDRSVSRQRYRWSPIPVYYEIPEDKVALFEYTDPARKHKEWEETTTREVIQLIVKDKDSDLYCFVKQKKTDDTNAFFGWIDVGETAEQACIREAYEEAGLVDIEIKKQILEYQCKFYHPTKNRNQYSMCTCYYAEADRATQVAISDSEAEEHDVVWLTADEFREQSNNDTSIYCLNVLTNKEQEERPLIAKYNEFNPLPESEKTPQLIPEQELPVELPLDLEVYKPKGKSPLEDHATFPLYKKDGKTYLRECDTLDTFVCSSFYFLRFPSVGNNEELISQELANNLMPIPLYTWGKEHTVGHLLYSRFIHKFLYDEGILSTPEPFTKLVHQGMVLGADGRKMGKRYGNGVDPLDVIERYGVDALRTYMMFMWPVEQDKAWNDWALNGVKKFLDRVEKIKDLEWYGNNNQSVESALHQAIQWITYDMENMKLNTGVSKLMVLTNSIYEHKACTQKQLETLTLLIAPYATELADRLWKFLWKEDDVHFHLWPVADLSKIHTQKINLPIQINGKVRGTIDIDAGLSQDAVVALAQDVDNIKKYIMNNEIKKVIWIQDKILNIII